MTTLVQTAFYLISPLVTLLAVSVAYVALVKQSRPHILVQYQPNPGIQTLIDLVIENIGGGMAREVVFSQPLPAQCYGIERAVQKGSEILGEGLPAIAAGQKYIFDGGQFAGLEAKLGEKMELEIYYKYSNPLGFERCRKETCILSISHLRKMPTRTSAEQAIVEALEGPNVTTLQRIEKELKTIGSALNRIAKDGKAPDGNDA